ncbi:hypothetical protein [Actinomadura sp. DC4]|uniref:hypothetical protein n=1 Tax=Actinomadura sp. DC4 TaxID=3055069 RepID=UPI00339D5DCF
MLRAAAEAVAGMVDATAPGAPPLPPVDDLREVSVTVAAAAQAAEEDLARVTMHDPAPQVRDAMWQPEHRPTRAGRHPPGASRWRQHGRRRNPPASGGASRRRRDRPDTGRSGQADACPARSIMPMPTPDRKWAFVAGIGKEIVYSR